MRDSSGSRTIPDLIALGLIEGVMTMAGFIVIIFPLALWAVPQQGALANSVFYVVLVIGLGALVTLIGLAYFKGLLFPAPAPQGGPKGGKARLLAYQTWSQSQDELRKVENQFRAMKGGALYNFTFMIRIAAFLITVYVLLNIAAWAFMDFNFGSTEILSAEERWRRLHPDHWNWK
ncbi:MAG: hypothetical protein HN478_19125 [Rhodospirillaceae bacterium]|nr:hypothetical protein [Rhodospirillaceae bacterium]MBT4487687.1 hypothetical protein [Rhodospirillaceae bacterium]MBT5195704.1 hypothetical protein [Rhodospirillaceae bacterium]MBT5895275.1 hypothetical protein [Rhodospirillaceae bacterium]MBT6428687.1 hypothetical protein [Rhodospirillaceae bacterium]